MSARPLRIAFDLSATRLGQAGVARAAQALADALEALRREAAEIAALDREAAAAAACERQLRVQHKKDSRRRKIAPPKKGNLSNYRNKDSK